MEKQANWWEPIFSGELEVGIDKDKMETADQESFLYHAAIPSDLEQQA
ncbi:hypothetical protein HNQ44_000506 [Planomicrobium koreense]|jgi:hypothetical protein|uniref:Uncharacterized protein n=1 Tax=Planococcus koreensis TaxID=112331 RepID=A0A7W8CQM9_9BACL|nr:MULTISPECIES: hypothetical protein [Planococcus]MBB5179084.1 hypothetical protein [Planococcus koreensis]MDN3450252.1 hypothetical protein [Planococcus sp. APC 3906]